jgi:hypothetical protein
MPRNGIVKKEYGVGAIQEQLRQICADYSSLPDVRDITISEIRFFYSGLIPGIIEMQKKDNK